MCAPPCPSARQTALRLCVHVWLCTSGGEFFVHKSAVLRNPLSLYNSIFKVRARIRACPCVHVCERVCLHARMQALSTKNQEYCFAMERFWHVRNIRGN